MGCLASAGNKKPLPGLEEVCLNLAPVTSSPVPNTGQELAPDPPNCYYLEAVAVASSGLIPRPLWMIQGLNQLFNCKEKIVMEGAGESQA